MWMQRYQVIINVPRNKLERGLDVPSQGKHDQGWIVERHIHTKMWTQ
jgi:hypothetical protein